MIPVLPLKESIFLCNAYTLNKTEYSNAAAEKDIKIGAPKHGETGYMQIKMTDVLVSSAKSNQAAKPDNALKKLDTKKPGNKASDYLLDLSDVKGELKDK